MLGRGNDLRDQLRTHLSSVICTQLQAYQGVELNDPFVVGINVILPGKHSLQLQL
jgi:hypothetical protein